MSEHLNSEEADLLEVAYISQLVISCSFYVAVRALYSLQPYGFASPARCASAAI